MLGQHDLTDGVEADVHEQGDVGITEHAALFVRLAKEAQDFVVTYPSAVPAELHSVVDVLGRDQIEDHGHETGVFDAFVSVGWIVEGDGGPEDLPELERLRQWPACHG